MGRGSAGYGRSWVARDTGPRQGAGLVRLRRDGAAQDTAQASPEARSGAVSVLEPQGVPDFSAPGGQVPKLPASRSGDRTVRYR